MTEKLQPQHANVVRVLAVASSPSALFVVMDLCRFGLDQQPTDFQDYLHSVDQSSSVASMASFLAEGHMVLNALVQDLLRGTAFLHSKQLCHCDIKPANVLCAFDRKGKHRPYRRDFFQQAQLKLTDFGTFQESFAVVMPHALVGYRRIGEQHCKMRSIFRCHALCFCCVRRVQDRSQ